MQYVAASVIAAPSGTTPTHAVGDLLVVVAYSFYGTIPSLPTGWTSAHTNADGLRVGYKVATSTADSTGTWTNADELGVGVWRNALSLGNVASAVDFVYPFAAGPPALTTSDASSWVATFARGGGDAPATPTGTTSRWSSGYFRWCDTGDGVASFSAFADDNDLAVSMEVTQGVTPVDTTLDVSRDVLAGVSTALDVSRKVEALTVDTTLDVSRDVLAGVTTTLDVSRDVDAFTVPPDWAAPVVVPAIDRKVRTLSARAELVDATGTPVTVTVGTDEPRSTLPLASASVSFKGEVAEQWAATLTFTDPWMIPTDSTHPLWGARNYYVRLWWRILDDGEWTEHLVCTVAIGNSGGQDTGTISGTVQCRDVLSTARGGYGGPLDVGGLTVDEALRAIFERVAPTLPLQVGTSTVTLPDVYELGEQDPAKDWTEIAALAGWVVRTGRDGTVVAGPRPTPTVALDWSEGPDCPVTELSWDHGIEHMGNRITVRSSDPDYVGVYATVQDDDPASPTWVGGPWGVHPLPSIDSDAVTTVEAATNLARMHLGRGLRPVEDVSVTIPQRPDLEYRQVVHLARRQVGIGADYRISSWDLDLPVTGQPPAPMSVRMMQRTVEE